MTEKEIAKDIMFKLFSLSYFEYNNGEVITVKQACDLYKTILQAVKDE